MKIILFIASGSPVNRRFSKIMNDEGYKVIDHYVQPDPGLRMDPVRRELDMARRLDLIVIVQASFTNEHIEQLQGMLDKVENVAKLVLAPSEERMLDVDKTLVLPTSEEDFLAAVKKLLDK